MPDAFILISRGLATWAGVRASGADSRKVLCGNACKIKRIPVETWGQDIHNNDDGTMNDCRGALCSCTFQNFHGYGGGGGAGVQTLRK